MQVNHVFRNDYLVLYRTLLTPTSQLHSRWKGGAGLRDSELQAPSEQWLSKRDLGQWYQHHLRACVFTRI